LGAPPEINSVINPVRATSVPLILARVKNVGMEMNYADAAKLAQQSRKALLDRLRHGGESMPAFSHLSDAEIQGLLAYLMQLAQVPGSAHEGPILRESRLRVGELIARSTCHTCHSATGHDPGPEELMAGAIPPLSKLTARKNQAEFIRKVASGAPVLMGVPPTLCRGRMPVFYYLSEEEAADVYLYLTLYPPLENDNANTQLAASLNTDPPADDRPQSGSPVPVVRKLIPEKEEPSQAGWLQTAALPLLVVPVTVVLTGGLYFTFREFKRLSEKSASRVSAVQASHTVRDKYDPTVGIDQGSSPVGAD
jgi:mono/diheme cytochrome c family protein